MTLGEIIRDLAKTEDSLTIYAAQMPKWTVNSEAELSPETAVTSQSRLPYLLEVSFAKQVLKAWSFARGGRVPNFDEQCRAIIFYAENDAYILPEHEQADRFD